MSRTRHRSRPKAPPEKAITAHEFVGGDARLSVPLAGLLFLQPDLAEASLTRTAWQDHLDTYLAPARPRQRGT